MVRATTSIDWPDCFQPWPVQVIETETEKHMYTDEEVLACKEWLNNPAHRQFKKWATAKVDTPSHWFDLELVIKTALMIEPRAWSQHSKDACQEVWVLKGPVTGKQHNTASDNKKIGEQTATLVLEGSDLRWMEEGLEWAKLAFTALAPRLNSLAKKVKKRAKKEPGVDNDAKSIKSTESIDSTTTATIYDRIDPALRPRTEVESTLASRKRQKTEQPRVKTVSSEERMFLPHKVPVILQRPLCNRNIVVQHDQVLVGNMRASVVSRVVVSISAIVEEGAQEQHHVDIRCNHLSWNKFKQLLEETDPTYGINGTRRLFWVEPSGVEGEVGTTVEIGNEAGFRCAVGTLEWKARQDQTNGHVLPLSMYIKDLYRY